MSTTETDWPPITAALEQLAPDRGTSYSDCRALVSNVRREFLTWSGRVLQEPLDEHVRRHFDFGVVEGRQRAVRWLGDECRMLGLAIACPNTERPSLLMIHSGKHPGSGSFLFENRDAAGNKYRACYRRNLPPLRLIPDSAESNLHERQVGSPPSESPARNR